VLASDASRLVLDDSRRPSRRTRPNLDVRLPVSGGWLKRDDDALAVGAFPGRFDVSERWTRTSCGACGVGVGKSWQAGRVPKEVTTAARMLILQGGSGRESM